jgi:hypothetical protein
VKVLFFISCLLCPFGENPLFADSVGLQTSWLALRATTITAQAEPRLAALCDIPTVTSRSCRRRWMPHREERKNRGVYH